jgi:hypothetical protein
MTERRRASAAQRRSCAAVRPEAERSARTKYMVVCRPTSRLPPSTSSSTSAHAYHALAELLGEPDEKSFGAADVAEPIRVFVLDYFADELRAALAEPGERLVDVVHGEHDA